MELIRISQNKIKIMLTETDMQIYEIPESGSDYTGKDVRDTFRAVLKEAGKQTGVDFSGGKLAVQFYPSRKGGCEMFVTKFEDSAEIQSVPAPSENRQTKGRDEGEDPSEWKYSEAFAFHSLEHLLAVCRALLSVGFAHRAAVFTDDCGRYYLLVDSPGIYRPLMIEYGASESPYAVGLYIAEHGKSICSRNAVEILGNF